MGVNGSYARYIFVVAAITKVEAINMVQEYTKVHGMSDLCTEFLTDSDVTRVSVDAAVDHDGVLYCDGYEE